MSLTDLASDHLRKAALSYPRQIAIENDGRALSWSEFDEAVERLARRLVAAGLAPGQSVMILSENSPEFLISCFAVWRAAGTMAVVHASFAPEQLDYAVRNAEPHFLFAEVEYRAAAQAALERTGTPARIIDLEMGVEPMGDMAAFDGELPKADPAAAGVIGYTSGTTGMPKPVALSHGTIGHGTQTCAKIWRIDSADTILVSMPLSWLAGLIILSTTATSCGAKIHLLRRLTAEDALDALTGHGVTFFFGPTSSYVKMLNAWHQRGATGEFRLRCCISGGEARNEAIFGEWRDLTGIPVLDSYGASECWPFVTHDPGIATLPPPGSAGKLVEGARLRLVGPEGQEVAPGEVGEAQGLAPCMLMEYWKEPELTAQAMTSDGWYRIGDCARVDRDGYVYILGRASDAIVRNGTQVFPAEVEQVLSELDAVAQVAVVGLPDPDHGQSVAAAVVLRGGATADEAAMRAHCAARLAEAKIPGIIRIVKELPHNPSGKVLRREVIPMLSSMQEAKKG
nr:class I adenylate-forming enzyme family protein [Sphingomonas sp. CDS-1]